MSLPVRSAVLFLSLAATSTALAASRPSPLTAPRPVVLTAEQVADASLDTFDVLDDRAAELGLRDGSWDVEISRVHADAFSHQRHVRVQQYVDDVPVFEGEGIVHFTPSGRLVGVTDAFARDASDVDTTPTLSRVDAVDIALAEVGLGEMHLEQARTRLYVFMAEDGPRLAWQVRLATDIDRDEALGLAPTAPLMFVDAHTGEVLGGWDDLQHSATTGSGSSSYYGSLTFANSVSGSTYYLEDVGRHVGAFDNRNRTSSAQRYSDSDNGFTSSSQKPGVDVLVGLQYTYDWYLSAQGLTGMNGSGGITNQSAADGSGGLITGRARYGNRYNNAFWSGSYMVFGSGDGSTFGSLSSLDVVAHEYSHGVSGYWVNLTYSSQSGALNESFSDIMAVMVEYAAGDAGITTGDWTIGEDCYTPSTAGDAMRYFDNPHNATNYGYTSNDDPDHWTERYTGSADNGGVHINSGIVNHMFYRLSEGGTHHLGGAMTAGIGRDAAARIVYVAMADYMTSGSTFSQARTAMLNAAAALYGSGSAEYIAVGEAWTVVGVS